MAAITTTGTLTAGNSRTFALAPGSALTLTLLPNCRVTVTETPETVSASDAGGNSPRTQNHQLAGVFTYGPYAMGGSVVVDNAPNSGSTVTWGRKDTTVSTSSDGRSLVSGDGDAVSIYQSPTNTAQAPYAAMVGPTQLIGSALTGTYPFMFMESFWEAIRRKSCKMLFLGDSVTENIAQNWPMGHWTIELERELMRAFPDVAFEFVNISIGGKIALQVLGRAAGSAVPDSSLGSSFLSSDTLEDNTHYQRVPATGINSPTNPETWQGSASGVTQWTNGEVWMNRIAPHNFDVMTLCFGLNEETAPASNWWFAASIQAIISNVRTHSTFDGFTRPSIICATPYNDTVDRPLRNRLAEQMFAVAQKNGCPVIDANRWDGIAVEGVDRCRQRWYGEGMWRYLVGGKNANDLLPNKSDYWDITGAGTLSTGAGGTSTDYISTANSGRVKLLRKKAVRDVQMFIPFNSNSGGGVTDGIVSLWYRVDPQNIAVGYELKYEQTGTLSLIYHDGTTDVVIYTKSIYAIAANSTSFSIYLRCVGAVHECWTVFGSTAPATGYDPRSMQLQFRTTHAGSESGKAYRSDIFRDGWCGVELNSTGAGFPALRAGNYPSSSAQFNFGYPLMVNQMARVDQFDMNGRVSLHMNYQTNTAIDHDGDNRGGNTINHLATDAYSLVYAAAIGSVVRQLAASRQDVVTISSSGVAVTAPADTSENILATIAIPAGMMGKNTTLDVQFLMNFTGSTNSKTIAAKFGPTLGGASIITSVTTASASNLAANMWASLKNRGDYKKQSRIQNVGVGPLTIAATETTIDTTVDNYIYITGTKASAGEVMKLERYSVQLVGG